ncbi:MAG: 50S ribosomal protein L1 [Candidatus Micrarchaeia archaeon]
MTNNKALHTAVEEVLKEKGTRKFQQTVELVINFKDVDFTKPENRLNLEIPLPKGRGKQVKVAVFADGQFATDAKKAGADIVYGGDSIDQIAKNKPQLKKLANEYVFLAEPKLMVAIGKSLGQVLGAKGKMPKPLTGKTDVLIERSRRTVFIKSKGKYMPVAHVPIGTESMPAADIVENAMSVLDTIKSKVGEHAIKNVYVKLTMGKPVKVG